MTRMNIMFFSLSVMLLTGCTSIMQARNIQPSSFLGEDSSRLQVAPEGGPIQGYRNPAVNWPAYSNSLGFWTDQAVYRLCVLRGEAGCVEPWG